MTCDDDAGPAMGKSTRASVGQAPRPWTRAELQMLRAEYARALPQDLERALPGRSWSGIQCMARDLRAEARTDAERQALTRRTRLRAVWLPAENALIREHYGVMAQDDLLQLLPGRTWRMVLRQASRLRVRGEVVSTTDAAVRRQRERRRLSEAARHEAAAAWATAWPHDPMRQCPSVWHLAQRVAASVGVGARA